MKRIKGFNFKNKKTIIRVDFNVPLNKDQKVTDNSRLIGALKTIKTVIKNRGIVILISHLGRPKGKNKEELSLKHVLPFLKKELSCPVSFFNDCVGIETKEFINQQKPGSVTLLENLRFYPEEELGDVNFAKELASLADIYINDAFGTAHRAHASTSIITQFFKDCLCGELMYTEISNLKTTVEIPQSHFTAIIGGAKISGKIEVIKSLIKKVDSLIIGGGMAYTFIKALGGSVGKSLVEEEKLVLAKEIIILAKEKNVALLLPVDSKNSLHFNNDSETDLSDIYKIKEDYMGLDIGPKTIDLFKEEILKSKTIIWNGPMGVFEMQKFEKGTKSIAIAICEATKKGAYSLIGGGDSVAAIKQFKLEKQVSYISSGGGAMLEYLEGKELPGIIALL
jgi:phosphoglycerate kinase|tara:strand:- start:12281 stop:13465 length:1185 start_codon:yes stop_codon:yes gene_type:complete